MGRSKAGEQTERPALARARRARAHAFLMLTATPQRGKTPRLAALRERVRPDREPRIATLAMKPEIVRDIIIRNCKSPVTDAKAQVFVDQVRRPPVAEGCSLQAMAPLAGFVLRQVLHADKSLEIQLSEELRRASPGFGPLGVLRLTVDHPRVRRDRSLILVDVESAFIPGLADLALDRLALEGLLTVHRLRWHDLAGQLLEEDLLPILSKEGKAGEMDRKDFAERLAAPFDSAAPSMPSDDRPVAEAARDGLLAKRARPDVMPGSVMTMAGLRVLTKTEGGLPHVG